MGRHWDCHWSWMAGLSLTALALCMAICLELAACQDGAQADAAPADAVSSPRPAVSAALADQRDRWFNEVVSRPLFSPDRRPVANQDRGGAGLPRLTAIIVDGVRRIAVFEAQAGGHATVVETGARIGGYEVREIAKGRMTMAGPEGTVTIHPTFDGAPRQARADAAAPVGQFDAEPASRRAALPAYPAFFNVTAR